MPRIGEETATHGLAVLILFGLLAAHLPCHAQAGHPKAKLREKIDRKQVEDLQRWVNEGHEPWRLDNPELLANQKLLELKGKVKEIGSYKVPPRQIVDKKNLAVFLYDSVLDEKTYRVTLEKFQWLLPLAKRWEWTIWYVTAVDVIESHCSQPKGER